MRPQISLQKAVTAAIFETGLPVFAACHDAAKSQIVLHVRRGSDVAQLESQVRAAMASTGTEVRVSVCAHRLDHLAHPRSLEHWQRRFGTGEVLYDPTMIVSRTRELVAAVRASRSVLVGAFGGFFFDPDRRALLVLDRGHTDAATLRARVIKVLDEAWTRFNGTERSNWLSVQVVPALPRRKLVAIDASSASIVRKIVRAMRRWFSPAAVAVAVSTVAIPAAAHVDSGRLDTRGQSERTLRVTSEFGVLGGLSIFTDGQVRDELNVFAAAGLRQYFGGNAEMTRLAQVNAEKKKKRRLRDPDELGQVGGPGS